MVISKTLENFLLIQKDTNFVEILIRKTIHYWQTSHIHRPYLIDNGCQPRLQFNSVCLIYFFSFTHIQIFFLDDDLMSIEQVQRVNLLIRNLTQSIVTEKCSVMCISPMLLNSSDQTRTDVFNLVWLQTFKMCIKALFEKKFLTYASWISMQIKASSFLHILNIYSYTKLNTPVLV